MSKIFITILLLGIYFFPFHWENLPFAYVQDVQINENLQLEQQLNVPSDFSLFITRPGVEVYQDTSETKFVEVVNLEKGASVSLLHGEPNGFDSKPGGYGLPNPLFTRQSLQEVWEGYFGAHDNSVCITNGAFFSTNPDPAPLAFSLKKDGVIISGGYAVSGPNEEYPKPGQSTPNQKLMLEIWSDHLDIKELTEANLKNSSAPNIIAGLTEDADKNPSSSTTRRTFVGIDDPNDDGKFDVLLVFNSVGDTQATAANILRSFSANPNPNRNVKVMMLDGGPSTQLLCGGKSQISSSRRIPQTIVVSSSAEISISPIVGQFYGNSSNGGAFTATPESEELFQQTFPVINFNPPSGTIPCSNNTSVGVSTRPFTDVVPQSDGSCLTIIAQGNGHQAGVGTLGNFQAVFTGSFTLSAAAQVAFNIFSDDGWILSIGPNSDGKQPTYVSGPLINPPSKGPFSGFSIVGSYNTGSTPTQRDLVVNFPAAGTYRFELDYTEGYLGNLSLTLKADSQPLPAGGSISGYVYEYDALPENLLPGSIVQVCRTGGECRNAIASANGQYTITGLASGEYFLTAFPPGSSNLLQSRIGPIDLSISEDLQDNNIILTGPVPPPSGTSITSRRLGSGGIPIVYWAEPLTLTTKGCVGGTANYQIIQNGSTIRSGSLQESSPGNFTTLIQPLYPNHGNAQVSINITCDGNPTTIVFNIYIDPSGHVLTLDGLPVNGAIVTLFHAESLAGPFEQVPDGNGVMAMANRRNPDLTDNEGRFGWDTVAGYYKVRAAKEGCTSPTDPNQLYVESDVVKVPPAVTDLDLRLDCGPVLTLNLGSNLRNRSISIELRNSNSLLDQIYDPIFTGSTISDVNGNIENFFITGVAPDMYNLFVKPQGWLQKKRQVTLVSGSNLVDMRSNFDVYSAGDINGNNKVDIFDYQILSNDFNTTNSRSDLNGDGWADLLDFQLLSNGFGKVGEGGEIIISGASAAAPLAANTSEGQLTLVPSTNTPHVGDVITVNLDFDTATLSMAALDAMIDYDQCVLEPVINEITDSGIFATTAKISTPGTLEYEALKWAGLNPGSPVSGTGNVAIIPFRVISSVPSSTTLAIRFRPGSTYLSNMAQDDIVYPFLGTVGNSILHPTGTPQRPSQSVQITSPSFGEKINQDLVLLQAQVSDPCNGIHRVSFSVFYDGQWHTVGTDTEGADGWALYWDASQVADQVIKVKAFAGDFAGNGVESAIINSIILNRQNTTFADVSTDYWAWDYIERLYNAGITGGCSMNPLSYCPEAQVTRAQMAVFLEKGLHYPADFTPSNVVPTFNDTAGHWAEDWIEALKNDGITGGCGGGNYCPNNPVTRAQMAVFLLKSKYGSGYIPPYVGGSTGFDDVPVTHWAAPWIKQLSAEGITGGCGGGDYCPNNPVTRAQMAVFLVKSFSLP